jgi:hypothetical protein
MLLDTKQLFKKNNIIVPSLEYFKATVDVANSPSSLEKEEVNICYSIALTPEWLH